MRSGRPQSAQAEGGLSHPDPAQSDDGHPRLGASLPPQWNRAEFLSRVLRQGLALVGDDAFAVGNITSPAIRVSLGAARNRPALAPARQFLTACSSRPSPRSPTLFPQPPPRRG